MKARFTLKLAAFMAMAVSLLSLLAMGLQYRLVETRLTEATTAALNADLAGYAALYQQRRIIALRQAINDRASTGAELLLLQDRNHTRLAGSETAWPPAITPQGSDFSTNAVQRFHHQGSDWLGVARILPGGFPLLVARSLTPVEATLASLRKGMAALGGVLLAAGAVVGSLAAKSVMTRIARINNLADQVANGDLTARIPGPSSPDEFGLLETHVHAMLDRIENLNRATHRLSDTIAHELRTPLNRMVQKLAQIEGQPELTAQLKAEMRNAIRVFDSLLDISRAEADQGGGGLLPVDLSAVVAEVWDLYEPLAEDKGLICTLNCAPDLQILGDRNLIAQMLSNLIDNAIKYCAQGDSLSLTLQTSGPQHCLILADSGPGLPADLRDAAFERFTRAPRDQERGIKGHGLGLALVRAIAARHGAKLSLPEVDAGLTVEILWPKL
ncbi:two-component sensor histidine kinase [Cypionkella aquatica]|uniref:histidine kinase n=1 Tax=Cypionkella aquatica TaxID=1756042 RepID=A0AA37TX56_9RHOB|nr:HAMP domain-containing sensor histidine kinase [Cypionkella aquatica]GLS87488.1 two-component sensor histidine kinase [Cypionkella aquatica]